MKELSQLQNENLPKIQVLMRFNPRSMHFFRELSSNWAIKPTENLSSSVYSWITKSKSSVGKALHWNCELWIRNAVKLSLFLAKVLDCTRTFFLTKKYTKNEMGQQGFLHRICILLQVSTRWNSPGQVRALFRYFNASPPVVFAPAALR